MHFQHPERLVYHLFAFSGIRQELRYRSTQFRR